MRKAIILGAAGRDFHDFNVVFRGNPDYEVVAFTAAQIPGIAGRVYPAELAGPQYPNGIPIVAESELAAMVEAHAVDEVIFAYSDTRHEHVMHLASIALAAGASYRLLGPRATMLAATLPVIAVVAARTGAGKSTVSRYLMAALMSAGRSPVAIRHPMPYGDLTPRVERYACAQDVCDAKISVEAMEEYQQHVAEGFVVFAGVDYVKVLGAAETEADAIVWDGGNNDMPFLRPNVTVTVLDPVRPNQGAHYFPGEVNIRAADILLVNKVNVAQEDAVQACIAEARRLNPKARVLRMQSVADVDHAELIRARRVLAVDDGPSLTHGGLSEGVAGRTARSLGAELVDPRPFAVGSLARAYEDYPHIGCVLPALGYGAVQLEELARTIDRTPCDAVLLGTPAPLERLFPIAAPVAHARFYGRDVEGSSLAAAALGLAGIGGAIAGA